MCVSYTSANDLWVSPCDVARAGTFHRWQEAFSCGFSSKEHEQRADVIAKVEWSFCLEQRTSFFRFLVRHDCFTSRSIIVLCRNVFWRQWTLHGEALWALELFLARRLTSSFVDGAATGSRVRAARILFYCLVAPWSRFCVVPNASCACAPRR